MPPKRNSHTMVTSGDKAYIFGGANSDGPRKDLFELDLTTYKYKSIKLNESECQLPMIEMHTAHIYQGDKLLLIGGRALEVGKELDQIMFSDTIYQVDLTSGKVSQFCLLPSALGSHVSFIVDDKYLLLYGGTNGLRFFDSILRCDLEFKLWTTMTKQPSELVGSPFFKDGRIASSYSQFGNGFGLAFGGCSAE